MCDLYCQSADCSDYEFDDLQLMCKLNIKASILKKLSIEKDGDVFDVPGTRPVARMANTASDNKTISQHENEIERDFLEACEDDSLKDVKKYLEIGEIDINCRNEYGETCVMTAAMKKDKDMFDFLIQLGCDLLAVDEDTCTVLHLACLGGSIYIVKKLVDEYKLDIHRRDKYGRTPVLYAPNRQVLEYLEERGADLKTIDEKNNNILHMAAKKCHVEVALYVLSLNIIDPESRGQSGKTPLNLAVRHGCNKLIDILHIPRKR